MSVPVSGGRSGRTLDGRPVGVSSVEPEAERREKGLGPLPVAIPGVERCSPVHRAVSDKDSETSIEASLSAVTLTAEKSQVLLGERSPEGVGFERTGHVDRQPVVDLQGSSTTTLTHRHLQLGGSLTRCNAVSVQAVHLPGQGDCRSQVSSPAADAPDGRVTPSGSPQHQPARMLRRMPPVMSRQSLQSATSYPSSHTVHESAFPLGPGSHSRRGVPGTTWIPIDHATYDTCRDPRDYRPRRR